MISRYHKIYIVSSTIVFLAIFLAFLYYFQNISLLLVYICTINITTFAIFGWDKASVMLLKNKVRVPETILHTLAFLGGTPMALGAQILFRHKTQKFSFQIIYFIIVFIQLSILLYYFIKI